MDGWGQNEGNLFASQIPLHGLTGTGGENRRCPIGGCAYGIPRNIRACKPYGRERLNFPRTLPDLKFTITSEQQTCCNNSRNIKATTTIIFMFSDIASLREISICSSPNLQSMVFLLERDSKWARYAKLYLQHTE